MMYHNCDADCAVHNKHMGEDRDGERVDVGRQNRTFRILNQIDLPDLEPSQRDQAHRHGPCVHIRQPLLCRG